MWDAGGVDEVTWGALTLTLTAIGAVWTWFAFRRRGLAAGLRGAAFTLLPPAAFLTGTLEMFTEIGGSVADWATHLALSPVVWLGIVLAGVSAVLFVVSGTLRARQGDTKPGRELPAEGSARAAGRGELKPSSRKGEPAIDDDMAEIEAILRKRGIT
jgi:hypothetical protein